MKLIYARFILFFIRPALELYSHETRAHRYTDLDVFVADIRGGGSRAEALEDTYGLRPLEL